MIPKVWDLHDDGESLAFRDILFILLFTFLLVIMILIPFFNPPEEQDDKVPPGDIIVEIYWPDHLNVDIDLWVKPPTGRPVGYSNLNSPVFNLLRDDRGFIYDTSGRNYEFAASRGLIPGEWIVNLHYYANQMGNFAMVKSNVEIEVKVVVSRRPEGKEYATELYTTDIILDQVGREVTAVRFRLDDEEGDVVPGSINEQCVRIRSPDEMGKPC